MKVPLQFLVGCICFSLFIEELNMEITSELRT